MATLTLIGEPIPNPEAAFDRAAAIDLATALAVVAPRGCSSRLLLPHGAEIPTLGSARARAEHLPLKANLLPYLWRAGPTARPLDDEFVHALTPLVPLRHRSDDDGSQTSVTVTHALAWTAPERMGTAEARQYRAFARRALKLADRVLTPTYAVADALGDRSKTELDLHVMPLAAPSPLACPSDAAAATARQSELGAPERYIVTTAQPGEHDRLEWITDALERNADIPDVVVIVREAEGATREVPEAVRGRVHLIAPETLTDWGVLLSGALLFALPQPVLGAGYEVLGALDAGVPVLHAGNPVAAELALDGGLSADTPGAFEHELASLTTGDTADALSDLTVLAEDRGRAFSWETTAWQLWELHASL